MSGARLRIGIVGCGNIAARAHLPIWQELADRVEVVALADPNPDALERLRVQAGLDVSATHADAADLIARDDVDAVDVCTPQAFRRDVLVRAAEAGRHLLCEKPLAAAPVDAEAAVLAAERAGVVFATMHNFLATPEVVAVRGVIESGEIGTVRSVIVNFLGTVYEPGAAGDWRRDPALAGGGVLMDMLHGVYLAESLTGEPFLRASAMLATRAADWQVEDLATCRFETDSRVALVNIGWGFGPGGVVVTGTNGRVEARYEHGSTAPWAVVEHVTVTTAGGTRTVLGPATERRVGNAEFPSMYAGSQAICRAFVDAVLDGTRPLATGADGLRSLEATVGAYQSAATGQMVGIPLDRTGPVFLRGAMGVRELEQAPWSPLRTSAMFLPAGGGS